MTSYGSNGYYSVTYTAAHTYYSATASITVNEVGGGFLAYIVNTAVTAKAFNSYGDLYGTASSTGNYSCSATAYPGPGVALCINYSSASNLITSFNYSLSEE